MDLKPKPLPGGLLIVFEGIDGVGKTTQLENAEKWLSEAGWPVVAYRNLGGTPIGEELRKVILSPIERPTETNLYISVAIQSALIKAIVKERSDNKIILMDRGPLSLAAYEVYGSGLDEELGMPYVEAGMDGLKPELTMLFDADVDVALGRIARSEKSDYFESKSSDYFKRVADGYHLLVSKHRNSAVTIDAEQPIENVWQQTQKLIEAEIELKLSQL